MKATKKLAALFLAMVMTFSLMAVTAAAHDAEEHEHDETCCEATIQPRKPVGRCIVCGEYTSYTTYEESGPNNTTITVYWYDCGHIVRVPRA